MGRKTVENENLKIHYNRNKKDLQVLNRYVAEIFLRQEKKKQLTVGAVVSDFVGNMRLKRL